MEAFHFFTKLDQTLLLGLRAATIEELLTGIRRQFIPRYDAAVVSALAFSQKLPIPQVLIAPSIDPLSDKNKEPEFTRRLGVNAREHIRNNFLNTRHIKDYMLLFLSLFNEGDVVYL